MDAVEVSSADIARLADVRPTAVSNWRKRHADFPAPIGGTESSPRFDLTKVVAWLQAQGKAVTLPTESALLQAVIAAGEYTGLAAALNHALFTLMYPPAAPDPAAPPRRLLEWARNTRLEFTGDHPGLLALPELTELHPGEYAVIRSALAFADDRDRAGVAIRLIERVLGRRNSSGNPPAPLARLLVELAASPSTATVLDPASGAGSVLVAAVEPGRRLAGQTGDAEAAMLTALRLTLAGVEPSNMDIHAVDALHRDVFGSDTVSAVVSSLPPNDRDWASEGAVDRQQWPFGVPSSRDSELAWAQLALTHLHPDGRAALLLPASAATRPSGRAVRRELVRQGSLLAVFSLPRGTLEATAAAPQIWVLRPPHSQLGAAPSVLMVELTEFVGSDGPNWPGIRTGALVPWRAFRAAPHPAALPSKHARAVPIKELLDDRLDLSPDRYLSLSTGKHWSDERFDNASEELHSFLTRLREQLTIAPVDITPESRPAPLRELAELEAEDVIRIKRRKLRTTSVPGSLGRVLLPSDLADGRPPTQVDELDDPAAPVIRDGDVLATITSSRLHARLATADDLSAHLGPQVVALRSDSGILDPGYLAGYLAGETADRQIRRGPSSGIHVAADIRRIRIPIPPIGRQRELAVAFATLQQLNLLTGVLDRRMGEFTAAARDRLLAENTSPSHAE